MAQPGPQAAAITAAALRQLDDTELLRRIGERRQEALAELFDRHAPRLLGLAQRILGDGGDAEEVLQEVFLQVWGQARRFDPRRASAGTWLVLITRSRAIDLLRSRRVRLRTAEAAGQEPRPGHESPEAVRAVWYDERHRRLRAALEALPAEQREVLEMAFYQGHTQRQIAAVTGLPLGTVKTRTLLAMKKLRVALRDELEELL